MLSLRRSNMNRQANFTWHLQDNYFILRFTAIIGHILQFQTLLKIFFFNHCICQLWVWKFSRLQNQSIQDRTSEKSALNWTVSSYSSDYAGKRAVRESDMKERSVQVMFWVLFASGNVYKPDAEVHSAKIEQWFKAGVGNIFTFLRHCAFCSS